MAPELQFKEESYGTEHNNMLFLSVLLLLLPLGVHAARRRLVDNTKVLLFWSLSLIKGKRSLKKSLKGPLKGVKGHIRARERAMIAWLRLDSRSGER